MYIWVGLRPTGHQPTGHQPTGHQPTGHQPTGHQPTRHRSTGNGLTDHRPTGHRPTGHGPTGHRSSGLVSLIRKNATGPCEVKRHPPKPCDGTSVYTVPSRSLHFTCGVVRLG